MDQLDFTDLEAEIRLFGVEISPYGHITALIISCIALMQCHEQGGESGQHLHLAAVLDQAPQPGLLKSELPFDHAERMLHFGAAVRLGRLDQIINSALVYIR